NKANPIRRASLNLRNNLKKVLEDNLTENESGIMKAVLLGSRSQIKKHIRELFAQTGTAHILAISGLHIGIVAALFLVFIKMFPFSRRLQIFITIFLLVVYSFLTGGRPSVIRATIIAVVFLFQFILEKESDALNTLALAAFAILFVNPLNIFDVGFQLSFVCVSSIIFLTPIIKEVILKIFDSHKRIVQSLSMSISVWIGVLGLVAYYFNIISPITVLANLIVIPLISLIVALGFGLLIVGSLLPSAVFMFAICIKISLNALIVFVFLLSKSPFAYFYIKDVSLWTVWVYYGIVIFAFLYLRYSLEPSE
ncbi:MAG: ComEC/Rec2 family competence protein, partial [Candidatus Zapsychrus exili]|nr:ComEC/Rec2 family competence protein [Candidatus Zapsychrus exili]